VNFSKEAKDRKKEITKILFSIALWQKDKNTEFYENIMNELRQRLKGETETDLPAEEEYNHLIFEAELGYRDRDLENETKDLLRNLDQEISKENLKRLTEELHNAEREKENDKVKELLRDIQKEKKNLESLLVESQS
jgi:transcriptional regulator of heat shock response